MVLYLKREGGQSQFSMHLKAQFADDPTVERVQHFILNNLSQPLQIEDLAAVARLSARSLQRAFRVATGKSLGTYISDERLRVACQMLADTPRSFKEVASQSGLGSDANMRKVFMRELGVSPSTYRAKFQVEPAAERLGVVKSPTQTWRHNTPA
jgi:transcriptional regulator GlxA family with amidase domain